MEKLLEIEDLCVSFDNGAGFYNVIEEMSFFINKGETLGIVGESGSGKSVTSLAIMGLIPSNSARINGRISLNGEELLKVGDKRMQEIRGNKLAMIFQEPMTSLNPVHTCGQQIMEPILLHTKMTKKEAAARALELLTLCGIPAPNERFNAYPHQLSGGMRQRVMIAIALACEPILLIADEPTTALDVTVQAQILELMKEIKEKINMSIMMITHDLGIVVDSCDRVIIMYAGQIVESAPVSKLFNEAKHPYSIGLLKAIPRIDKDVKRLEAIEGMVPDADKMPQGCRFNPRCPHAINRCKIETPRLISLDDDRLVRCFLFEEESNKEVPE